MRMITFPIGAVLAVLASVAFCLVRLGTRLRADPRSY